MLIEIDKKIRINLENVTKEEQKALINMFDCARTEPHLLLMLSVIRDVFIQNQFVKSYILRLENRIECLEDKSKPKGGIKRWLR